jgi:hypothetical protein
MSLIFSFLFPLNIYGFVKLKLLHSPMADYFLSLACCVAGLVVSVPITFYIFTSLF